jgi:hypothetical protein
MSRAPVSAVIIARDEAARIGACLDSLAFCDERLVVDSGSTDGTPEAARAHGARVLHQAWLGYGAQKHHAVQQAAHDWVLCVDADERVSPALRTAVEQALAAPQSMAYACPRRNRFLGRWLRHGEGYPDWSLRLFHRAHARWSEDPVHERVLCDGPVARLGGDLLHESQDSLAQYEAKQERYVELAAQALWRRGVRVNALRPWLSPALRFLKMYLLRLGFLDGWPGLLHIFVGCRNSHRKYRRLRQLQAR